MLNRVSDHPCANRSNGSQNDGHSNSSLQTDRVRRRLKQAVRPGLPGLANGIRLDQERMNDFELNVTGGLLLAAASMLWLGWTLLPAKLGDYFVPTDFAAVRGHRRLWIWVYRVHLFGHVVAAMAFVALATLVAGAESRVIVWPAVAVLGTGLMMAAVAAAFYYHFGAWGSVDMDGKSDEVVRGFITSLRVSTEYVTCLVRFSRVFIGVGQVALGIGLLLQGAPWPVWLVGCGGLLGAAGMALTMGRPDDLRLYRPVFHMNALWLATFGVVTLAVG